MSFLTLTGRILLICAVSFILSVVAGITAKRIGVDITDIRQRTNPIFLFVALFFNLLFLASVALILKYVDHKNISVLYWSLDRPDILFSFLIMIVTVTLASISVWILKVNNLVMARWTGFGINIPVRIPKTLLVYIVLFVAALQEEVLFRGYLNSVLDRYGVLNALIWSTIIFTLWHFLTNKANLFQVIDWFLGGIMLFYVYIASHSIWVAALVHFSRNFANVIVFDIAGGNSLISLDKPVKPVYKTVYTLLLSIVVIACTYWLYGMKIF